MSKFDATIDADVYFTHRDTPPAETAYRDFIRDLHRAFNESIERAIYTLMMAGHADLYQAKRDPGETSICVGKCPAVGEHIHPVACTVSIVWSGLVADVVTTWHEPYAHLMPKEGK